jgi:hypothetical protein
MCCSGQPSLDLPGPVAEMLAEYRRLAGQDWLWGEQNTHSNAALLGWLRFVEMADLMVPAFERARAVSPGSSMQELIEQALAQDPDDLGRAALGGRVPPGMVAVRVAEEGVRLEAPGCRPVLEGHPASCAVLVDSRLAWPVVVKAGSETRTVTPGGAALLELAWEPGVVLEVDGQGLDLGAAFRPAEAGCLRLRSPWPLRWSVTDEAGGAWFPDGVLHKWDYHKRGFFHGADIALTVPSGSLDVLAWRGLEHHSVGVRVEVTQGGEAVVELEPPRRFHPAEAGWYGGDLHVHMNYAGDQVCTPEDAARMQLGEGLHLVNLVAANCTTSRIFDRQALEVWVGQDLPWGGNEAVARMGVEYRNDLLGHIHALNPARAPSRYHSGHAGSDCEEDWPPNSVAAADLKGLGATIGYCHPVLLDFEDDPAGVFDLMPRSVEAREVVVDAALGLIDSLDVVSNMSCPGSAVLYRRMIGAGCRLAVTAGTDCFLSFSRCSTFSNPPGWARVYAKVEGPLSVEGFQEAVRNCRTLATNGPWLEIAVAGHGPGETVAAKPGDCLEAEVRLSGPGAEHLRLITADGVLAAAEVKGEHCRLVAELSVGAPNYVVAEATGGAHPDVLAGHAFAHTSPVWVDVDGRQVARRRDAKWCLDWIDRLENLVRRAGRFSSPGQLEDLVAVLEQARAVYRDVVLSGD